VVGHFNRILPSKCPWCNRTELWYHYDMRDESKYCMHDYNEDKLIEVLAEKYGNGLSEEYFRQLFTTLAKISSDRPELVDLNLINSVLKELRYAFKIFKRYRNKRKVVIFGSHSTQPKEKEYKATEEFAKKITDKNFMVITGGGSGIMEAGNRGSAPGRSFAVNIKLPTEQIANPYIRGEKLVTLKYFFTRKLIFIKESDATVLFPGGFGTHDEGFEVLTLLQTGKTPPRPLVFVDKKFGNYWKDWYRFVRNQLVGKGLIHADDVHLFMITDDVDEAVDYVTNFYRNYHSLRYVGDRTIIRLNTALTDNQIGKLNRKYKDIIHSGNIEPCCPTAEEIKGNDNLEHFRLGFKFDRLHYGKLHQLILDINKL
jgi:uncharacterized protein (TIGR00730 family)